MVSSILYNVFVTQYVTWYKHDGINVASCRVIELKVGMGPALF